MQRARLERQLRHLRDASMDGLDKARYDLVRLSRRTARQVDRAAYDYPWQFVGISALLGALLGVAIGKRVKGF